MTVEVDDPGARVAVIVAELLGRGQTLAVAESLTGGLLAADVRDVPGVSAVFRGGLVVYATDLKATLAGVPRRAAGRAGAGGPGRGPRAGPGRPGALRRRLGRWPRPGVAGPDPQDGVPVGTGLRGRRRAPGPTWCAGSTSTATGSAIRAGAVAGRPGVCSRSALAEARP